jgi:transporter family protein
MLLALLASVLSGVSAVIEKVSVTTLSPLTVLTLRYALMLPVLVLALLVIGGHREIPTMSGRTWAAVLIPALMALASLMLYFTALKGDLVSRVFPLTELGPLVAFVLAAAFLGEPWSAQRVLGTALVIAGVLLVR